MVEDISSLRKEYSGATLDEQSVATSPTDQFRKWLEEAIHSELLEPNAMVLATSGTDNSPTQRTVLLKAYDDRGLVFFTNYTSKKARQIEKNPRVSLLFPWYGLERQVLVEGTASKITAMESFNYFVTRPFGSKLGAWISHQSEVITSRSILETKLEEMKRKFKDGKVPLPDFWGGYRVLPERYEFWQGRPNRLHDRITYSKTDTHWKIERLAP